MPAHPLPGVKTPGIQAQRSLSTRAGNRVLAHPAEDVSPLRDSEKQGTLAGPKPDTLLVLEERRQDKSWPTIDLEML